VPTPDRCPIDGGALIRLLYHQHAHALLAYATRVTGDRWAAEDMVQETLLRAWHKSAELDEHRGSIRGWLFTVVRNIATDRLRKLAARPTEVKASGHLPEMAAHHDHAELVVDSVVALDLLHQLDDEHRAVVVELYLRGRTIRETAQVLGIAPGTVTSRSRRALKKMRARLP
jgi:RNA polymerase sigma-70 factor (ECF subfamily)